MNKKILAIILFSFLKSNMLFAFETKAEFAILVDSDTNEVLFEKNSDMLMPPSSMSKLMTTYMVFEALKSGTLKLDDHFSVSENAWRKAGSKMFLHVNDQVTVENLLKGIIVQSGNDACIVIAEGMSGSEESFATSMNQKARTIGLTNSHFKNSTGWPDSEHLMSSRDLSILARRLIKDFPEYYHYFSEHDFTYNNIKQENRNMLLSRNIGVDGLKTGHTEVAGYGITASAKKNDRRLILVVNGLKGTVERARESEKLFQYGFLNFTNLNLYQKDEIIEIADVWLGDKKIIPLKVDSNIVFTLPKNSQRKPVVSIEYNSPLIAPIQSGQIIGKLNIAIETMEPISYNLIAGESSKALNGFDRFIAKLKYLSLIHI